MLSVMSILLLVVMLCVAAFVLWAINAYAPQPFKTIGLVVVLVLLVCWLVYLFFGDAFVGVRLGRTRI
jgi:uncharacterized membrane protein YukC